MDNNVLYKAGNYTISLIDRKDRIEYFEIIEDEFVKDKKHTALYMNFRHHLKQEIQILYTKFKDYTYVMRYNNKFIGFFTIEPPTDTVAPIGKKAYLIKQFRKKKAIACGIDFVMNFLYPNENIQINMSNVPGFEKIIWRPFKDEQIAAIVTEAKVRVRKICEGM